MSITHIPANDWAAVGARLERLQMVEVYERLDGRFGASVRNHAGLWFYSVAKTPLEALTAALDAAEGKYQ